MYLNILPCFPPITLFFSLGLVQYNLLLILLLLWLLLWYILWIINFFFENLKLIYNGYTCWYKKNKDRLSNRILDIPSTHWIFMILNKSNNSNKIIPIIVEGIDSLKCFCIMCPNNNINNIIPNCPNFSSTIPSLLFLFYFYKCNKFKTIYIV